MNEKLLDHFDNKITLKLIESLLLIRLVELDAEKIVLSILELLGQESLKETGSKIFKSEYKNEFLDIPHKSFQGPF
jgi:hypothetical protein